MFIFGNPKLLFLISKITFLDISNKTPFWHNYSGYQKLCQKAFYLRYTKKVILDGCRESLTEQKTNKHRPTVKQNTSPFALTSECMAGNNAICKAGRQTDPCFTVVRPSGYRIVLNRQHSLAAVGVKS